MARRAGKAASRRSRQRRAQRPNPPPPAAAPPPVVSAPSPARAYAAGGSSLTDRERAEYHYVERDLRNIGILTAILFALLIAAWLVSSALRGFG